MPISHLLAKANGSQNQKGFKLVIRCDVFGKKDIHYHYQQQNKEKKLELQA
jgi:hypothetical protein